MKYSFYLTMIYASIFKYILPSCIFELHLYSSPIFFFLIWKNCLQGWGTMFLFLTRVTRFCLFLTEFLVFLSWKMSVLCKLYQIFMVCEFNSLSLLLWVGRDKLIHCQPVLLIFKCFFFFKYLYLKSLKNLFCTFCETGS